MSRASWSAKPYDLDPGRTAITLHALTHPEVHAPFVLAEVQRRARAARRRLVWRTVVRRLAAWGEVLGGAAVLGLAWAVWAFAVALWVE